jgi:hypothetical protein
MVEQAFHLLTTANFRLRRARLGAMTLIDPDEEFGPDWIG